jgi:putative ABC transport system permease protein
MRNSFALARRFWRHYKARSGWSVISVMLAVGLVVALLVLSASLGATMEAVIARQVGLHHMALDYQQAGAYMAETDLDLVRNVEGVRDLAPHLTLYGRSVPPGMERYPIYIGVTDNPISRSAAQVIEGRQPGPGEVALPKPFAERMRVGIGSSLRMPFPPGDDQEVRVSGFTEGAPESMRGGNALFDMAWLQRVTHLEGMYTGLLIQVDRPDDTRLAAVVRSRLSRLFPNADIDAMEEVRQTRRNQGALQTMIMVLGAFSLLASLFLIAGNFAMTFRERVRELGALRAIGAARGFLFRLVLQEALITGVTGSVLGLIGGVLATYGLLGLAGELLGVDAGAIVIPWSHGLLAALGGLVVTLAASLVPAIRSSRVSAAAALKDSDQEAAGPRRRWGARLGLAVAGLGMGALLLAGWLAGDPALREGLIPFVFLGAAAVVVGSVIGLPALLPLVIGLLGRAARLGFRRESDLASRHALRYVGQARFMYASLTLAISLCLIAVSALTGVRTEWELGLSQTAPTPYLFRAAGTGSFPTSLAERASALPGVARVASIRAIAKGQITNYDFARADQDWYRRETDRINSLRARGVSDPGSPGDILLAPVSLTDLMAVVSLDVLDGRLDPDSFGNGGVVVPERWARNLGLRAGDTFQVTPRAQGPALTFTVVAVVKTVPTERPAFLIDQDLALSQLGVAEDQSVLIQPAQAGDTLKAALAGLQAEYPNVQLIDAALNRSQFMQEYGQRIAIVIAAVAVILTVSGASLVTLIATVLAGRRREFGMLRAAGATKGQVRLLIGLETLFVCVAGGLIAIGIGTTITWALLRTLGALSPMPSAGAAVGSLLAVAVLSWIVVRVGTRYIDRSSIVLALRAD